MNGISNSNQSKLSNFALSGQPADIVKARSEAEVKSGKVAPVLRKWWLVGVSTLLWCVAIATYFGITPRFHIGTVEIEGHAAKPAAMPFFLTSASPQSILHLQYKIDCSKWHANQYRFYADDWVHSINLNGVPVPVQDRAIRWNDCGGTLALGHYLKPGKNLLDVEIWNEGGAASLWVNVAPTDPLMLLVNVLLLLALAATLFAIIRIFDLRGWWSTAGAIFFLGVSIRILYFFSTPVFLRAYDFGGHLQYINYILEHCELPDRHYGWETFQAPLYYCLSAILGKITQLCGGTGQYLFYAWQFEALVISVIVLMLSVYIAWVCYPAENQLHQRIRFLLPLSVFPALVFYASRISNDVLFSLVSFVWLLCMLLYWASPCRRLLYAIAVVLALGLLTKTSTLLLLISTILIFCIQPRHNFLWKIKNGCCALSLVALIAGSYQVSVALREKSVSSFIVGNIRYVDARLLFDKSLKNLIIFNPSEVVQHPYSVPGPKAPRRDIFLEYYFKSAFFGEWKLPEEFNIVARALLISSILLLPFFLVGLCCILWNRNKADIPMLIGMAIMLSGHIAWVWKEPFACSQDFRNFVIVSVPAFYFVCRGIDSTSGILNFSGDTILKFQVVNAVVFLLLLCFS